MKKLFVRFIEFVATLSLTVLTEVYKDEATQAEKEKHMKKVIVSDETDEIINLIVKATKEKTLKGSTLSFLLNVPDRKMRNAINIARKMGVPILSGQNGYWYSLDPDEIRKFITNELDSRIDDLLRTKTALMFTITTLETNKPL